MLRGLFGDRETVLLGKMLDITAERHRVLANNIANADTPGFKRSDIRFRDQLASALQSGHRDALAQLKPEVFQPDMRLALRNDGNNVDIDVEMGEMAKNYFLYNINAQLLSKKYGLLRAAISGRP